MIFRVAAVLSICLLVFVLGSALAGELLSHPHRRAAGAPPVDLPARDVSFESAVGHRVFGWFIPGMAGKGAVLLLHGVRSDRNQMVARARFLHQSGYAILLIDLPAHGESGGDHITFGVRESAGVNAALHFLHQTLPTERVGVIGVSLGAASLVLAHPQPAPSAVVLESMFPTLREAVDDRTAHVLGSTGRYLSPALLCQLPIRFGINADNIRPIDALSALHAPVLIASGSADLHTTLAETYRLFEAAPEPKSLWIVPGAAHVDLHDYAPVQYEERVGAFLAHYLSAVQVRQAERPAPALALPN